MDRIATEPGDNAQILARRTEKQWRHEDRELTSPPGALVSAWVALFLSLAGCTVPETRSLDLTSYRNAFFSDCEQIEAIYEGHGSSGYYLTDSTSGNYTKAPLSLKEMVIWLQECGVDSDKVTQILE
jgi:hypothetical protein